MKDGCFDWSLFGGLRAGGWREIGGVRVRGSIWIWG